MSKAEILRRKQHLTEDGYQVIIKTVKKVYGKDIKRQMVDNYILGKRTGKGKMPIADHYNILPVFEALTDAEMERKRLLSIQTAKELMS